MMLLVCVLTAIMIAVAGYFIKEKKQYDFISGYNTMSDEKKAQVDIEWTAKIMGISSYILAGVLVIIGIVGQIPLVSVEVFAILLIAFIVLFVDVINIVDSKKNKSDTISVVVIIVVNLLCVGSILFICFFA